MELMDWSYIMYKFLIFVKHFKLTILDLRLPNICLSVHFYCSIVCITWPEKKTKECAERRGYEHDDVNNTSFASFHAIPCKSFVRGTKWSVVSLVIKIIAPSWYYMIGLYDHRRSWRTQPNRWRNYFSIRRLSKCQKYFVSRQTIEDMDKTILL